jgi:hypothetical protein
MLKAVPVPARGRDRARRQQIEKNPVRANPAFAPLPDLEALTLSERYRAGDSGSADGRP